MAAQTPQNAAYSHGKSQCDLFITEQRAARDHTRIIDAQGGAVIDLGGVGGAQPGMMSTTPVDLPGLAQNAGGGCDPYEENDLKDDHQNGNIHFRFLEFA